jgi:hypothetical protein
MAIHTVAQGERINSIAAAYGMLCQTIWNDSKNAVLRQQRRDPNALFPGDHLYIPDLQTKQVPCATDHKSANSPSRS